MNTAILTSRGRLTIPVNVRTAMQLSIGDRVTFVEIEPGRYAILAATLPVTALKGLVERPSGAVIVSVAAMNRAIRHQSIRDDEDQVP